MKPPRELVIEMTKRLTAEGKLIEAGWVGLKMAAIPENASQTQINESRMYFFAGAQHLMSSIISIMDPGKEPTDADMESMSKIHRELDAFGKEFILKYGSTEGNA